MFYGDYVKINHLISLDKYDEGTKEAVFAIGNCKKYVLNIDGQEYVIYQVDQYDTKRPWFDPHRLYYLVSNTEIDYKLRMHTKECFVSRAARNKLDRCKWLINTEDIGEDQFLDALKSNDFC